ncbi:cell wall-binding repeat-containing protein [Clostridium sp. P21]|uniref:Cell wall-binding repeat-containing protein n=1 Tax=Clostridium muellerianum TaxID=2716538 RepID=A0A7Y0EKC0_9CLOT|nr:cell wall-binding repeat-containing protein [Clostridium muellerianum]NMM65064.1 cell wall-binding repeat-containing protein [Clostridium muellerianum]
MNNKTKIAALASTALTALVLATAFNSANVSAAAGSVSRTSGADRYATASQVATKNWTTSDNIVLVSGEGYADAVSASALAKKLNAPILLTPAKNLDSKTSEALNTLKPKNIYVVGGNASVSKEIRNSLKSNYNLIELSGTDRYATNAAVAEKLVELGVDPANVMMVGGEGFSDALSVAPVAASKGQILLLGMNDANYIKPVTDFIKSHKSVVTVVGTINVINNDIYTAINGANRINGGKDRFDTNLKVLDAFKSDLKMDKAYIANASGDGYADALVASALAGNASAPLVIVDNENSSATASAIDYLKSNITSTTDLQVVGGSGVVSENTISKINAVVPTTQTPPVTTAPTVDMTTVTCRNPIDNFSTAVTFKLTGTDAENYTVTVKGKTAAYYSSTKLFGVMLDNKVVSTDLKASDFVITHK